MLPDVVCAGLVTGYGTVGAGIDRQAWLALQDAEATGAVDRIDYIETIDTRDRAENLAYFVRANYDIVVTTGAGIVDETIAAAKRHPDTVFVAIQPGHEVLETPENMVKLEFKEEQGGFLAGAAAAMLTRTNHVAAVCEARYIDYVERYCEGFVAGANFADEQVRTTVLYRDGADELLFQDPEWGQNAAAQAIQEGADVVFAVGEATGRAALLEAARTDGLVIGAQTDVFDEEPGIRQRLVTSAIPRVREGLVSLISNYLNEELVPDAYWGEMALAPFREFESRLPPGGSTRLRSLQADLASGALDMSLQFDGR